MKEKKGGKKEEGRKDGMKGLQFAFASCPGPLYPECGCLYPPFHQ